MKRFLIALLLVVLVIPCVFADETSKSEINWDIIDSVGVNAALDHISMRGKFNTSDVVTNKMTGFGVGLLVEADLSEIPHFLKPGWYGYFDLGLAFSKKIMFADNEYTNETIKNNGGWPTKIKPVVSENWLKEHCAESLNSISQEHQNDL